MAQWLQDEISYFDFVEGQSLIGKYKVLELLGTGWEGEVYKVKELATGILRAAKFFFPHRNVRNRTINFYARKLHKLKDCPILIQYYTLEHLEWQGQIVKFLVSEFVDGVQLREFIDAQPGKRLQIFEAMHLLNQLVSGLETIHQVNEYHGDLHLENIIVRRRGIYFDVKLVDLYQWHAPTTENMRDDVVDAIRIFYDCIGGKRYYPKQPLEIKQICCGLKRSLILKKFRNITMLKTHLNTFSWQSIV